jgi:FAD:protein FMN transferase
VRRPSRESVAVRRPVLGTVAEVRVEARFRRHRSAIEQRVFAALDRFEDQFSVFRCQSELARWRQGEVSQPSIELRALLNGAAQWQRDSGGVLNPAVGVLSRRWEKAANEGVVPSRHELADMAASVAAPRYVGGLPTDDCTALTFHSLAKGLIVDLAVERAGGDDLVALLVNVGGDLRRLGGAPIVVGIENPLRAYDNEPPLARVRLGNAALATSGGARRGWKIGGRWFSHVIDPRTGWPVEHIASASVVAADTMTADAIATVLSVLTIDDGLSFASRFNAPACIVGADGRVVINDAWGAISAM